MLKMRYFRVRLPRDIPHFGQAVESLVKKTKGSKIQIISQSDDEVIVNYRVVRYILIRSFSNDGNVKVESTPTMEQYSMRIFRIKDSTYLSLIDPPRGAKLISEMFDEIYRAESYFIDPLEFSTSIIEKHVSQFDSARLVSAKVRDFEVYEGAVGRLEITSHGGLQKNIAPFLEGKFHRIDSLTYEVSYRLKHGLIYYTQNGTLRVSGPLVEVAFPLFEACLT